MNDEMNISEMLKAAVKANDLRKKETLRLIEAGKAACEKIAEVAKKGIYGEAHLKDVVTDTQDKIGFYRLVAGAGPNDYGEVRIEKVLEYPYLDEKIEDTTTIAYAPGTLSQKRIPGKNPYGIPENYRLSLHNSTHQADGESVAVNYYPDRGDGYSGSAVHVPGADWFAKLPFHPMETESITRSMWIRVVKILPALADNMRLNEEKKKSDTFEAAEMASKIASSLK